MFFKPEDSDAGTLRIEVEDTGCGIGKEDLKRIASPYVQVLSEAARHGGTGLGLAICKQLANAMGGELAIMSSLGRGSTFAVTIPEVKVTDAAPDEEPKPTPPAKPVEPAETALPDEALALDAATPPPEGPKASAKRILIVDDQKMNLTVLRAMLKKLGDFDVAMASNGAEAIKALKAAASAPFDMVLTDMWMPELDGEGLVKAIRADKELASTPVYVVTADVEMIKKSESVGFTGILLKPITVGKLNSILHHSTKATQT